MPRPPQDPEMKSKDSSIGLNPSSATCGLGYFGQILSFSLPQFAHLYSGTNNVVHIRWNNAPKALATGARAHGKTLKKWQPSFCYHDSCYYLPTFVCNSHTKVLIWWHFWWSCMCLCFYTWCSFCSEVPISHQVIHSYLVSHSFKRVFAELPTTRPVDPSQSPPRLFPLDLPPVLKVCLLFCISVNLRAEKNALFPTELTALNPVPNFIAGT